MTSLISLIVVLFAAYAHSAPVIVTELQNATLVMEVENATSMARRGVTVGLSSSEESDSKETTQPTEKLSERDLTIDISTPAISIKDEREIDEESLSTEAVESSSMVDVTVPSSDEVKAVKRSADNQPWLGPTWSDKISKRSVELVESSTDVEEITTVESTSEVNGMKRGVEEFGLTTETSEAFNRRAIGSVESVEADESSTVVVIKVQPESTTEELSSSTVEVVDTTEIIRDESSSTSDYETTVVPVEGVPSETTPKILAIIPGTISRTRIAVQPVQISQGGNQTIVETTKQNY